MRKNAYKRENHPELQKGEVFLTNTTDPESGFFEDMEDWHSIGWKTKRLGQVAYDIKGGAISFMRPVFVKRSELKKARINPDKIWDNVDKNLNKLKSKTRGRK